MSKEFSYEETFMRQCFDSRKVSKWCAHSWDIYNICFKWWLVNGKFDYFFSFFLFGSQEITNFYLGLEYKSYVIKFYIMLSNTQAPSNGLRTNTITLWYEKLVKAHLINRKIFSKYIFFSLSHRSDNRSPNGNLALWKLEMWLI